MKKKIISGALAVLVSFMLIGCGKLMQILEYKTKLKIN